FPALIVALTGLVVLLVHAFTPKGRPSASATLTLFGLGGALAALLIPVALGACNNCSTTGGTLAADPIAVFLQALLLLVAIAVVTLSPSYLRAMEGEAGEYYALLMFSLVGM